MFSIASWRKCCPQKMSLTLILQTRILKLPFCHTLQHFCLRQILDSILAFRQTPARQDKRDKTWKLLSFQSPSDSAVLWSMFMKYKWQPSLLQRHHRSAQRNAPTCAPRPPALTRHTNQATLCLRHKTDAFRRATRQDVAVINASRAGGYLFDPTLTTLLTYSISLSISNKCGKVP